MEGTFNVRIYIIWKSKLNVDMNIPWESKLNVGQNIFYEKVSSMYPTYNSGIEVKSAYKSNFLKNVKCTLNILPEFKLNLRINVIYEKTLNVH